MTQVTNGALLSLLRLAWWGAVVLLILNIVVWPGLLDEPSTLFGSREGTGIQPRWIPVALVLWLLVGQRLIASKRSTIAGDKI